MYMIKHTCTYIAKFQEPKRKTHPCYIQQSIKFSLVYSTVLEPWFSSYLFRQHCQVSRDKLKTHTLPVGTH